MMEMVCEIGCFVVSTRGPPSPTLSPYTTLFRSPPLAARRLARTGLGGHRDGASAAPLDRKSTRLNSSHSQISYAVFCLKKKKNNRLPTLATIRSSSPVVSVPDSITACYCPTLAH